MTLEEVKTKYLGKSSDPEVFDVEKGSTKRYAVAVDDLNPYYLDEEFAGCSKYGSLLAPPGFFGWQVKQPSPTRPAMIFGLVDDLREAGFPSVLEGGRDFEFFRPIHVGDMLLGWQTITSITSKEGPKPMVFCVSESTYINQNGQLVAKSWMHLVGIRPVQGTETGDKQ